jgi:hypothetical protein
VRDDICDDGRVTDALPDFSWLPDLALRTLSGAVIAAIEVDGHPRDLA